MVLAVAMVLAGLAFAAAGVRVATSRRRPLDLAGGLLAPAGLLLALLGAGRALAPAFFGRPAPAPPGPLRIMPVGDSLTLGAHGAGKGGVGGYRAPLWRALSAAGVPVDFVGAARGGATGFDRDHEAWSGIGIAALAARLDRDLPAHRPDVLLLLAGLDELIAGASPDAVAARLDALLEVVRRRAPGAEVLVATLPAVRAANDHRLRPEAVAAVNARIRRLAAARGARVVDLHAVRALSSDGLHPSDAGYAEIARVWMNALRPALARRRL